MKRARLIVLAVAILAAGLAAYLANGFLGKPTTKVVKEEIGSTKVLVAKKDISLGDQVKSADLTWISWPAANADGEFIMKSSDPDALTKLDGSIARMPLLKNEPITKKKLIKANEGGVMAAILPAGMRAISTKITEDSAAGGFILPNDRVDVIVTRKLRGKGNSGEQHVSDTLFGNVRVLAIGQEIETKGDKKVATGKTATLELTPSQAETLALAQAMGDISLTLRSLAESLQDQGPTSNERGLKVQESTAIKILRYGSWSRANGVN